MQLTIRYRLFLFSLVVILVGAALTSVTMIFFQLRALEEGHQHFGKEFAEITGKQAIPALRSGDVEQLNRLLEPIIHEPDFVQHIFVDIDGMVLAGGDGTVFSNRQPPHEVTPYLETLSSTNKTNYWQHNGNIAITRRVADHSGAVVGFFHLELSREDIEEESRQILLRLVPVALLLTLFSLLASQRLANYFAGPLKEAVQQADAIASGHYRESVVDTPVRKDEFGLLSMALDTMAEKIRFNMEALNDVRLELEEMFHVMVDGVVVVDTEGKIQRINQRIIQMTGKEKDALIGATVCTLFEEEITLDALHGLGVERILRSIDGVVAVQVSGALIHPPHKPEPIGSVLLIHDLSDRIRAERQEQYAAFQAGVADMGASVLHNIGNVVTGMSGHLIKSKKQIQSLSKYTKPLIRFAEINDQVVAAPDTPDAVEKRLNETSELLRGVSKALDSFVDKISSIEKIDHGIHHIGEIISIQQSASRPVITATWFDIRPFIEDTLSLIEDRYHKNEIRCFSEIAVEIKQVCLPRNPLMQLLLNLLKNSLEAIAERRLTEEVALGEVSIRVGGVGDEHFELVVEDNGCGIPHNQLEQIFVARHTTKESGSGYGLHSAALFVKQIGGNIVAESEGVNRGGRLRVTLPLKVAEKSQEA